MQHFRICTLLKATLPALVIATALLGNSAIAQQEYTNQMDLTTNGQNLTLLLRQNRVTESMRVLNDKGQPIAAGVRTYTGKVKGDIDSWVRLTQSANSIEGVISRFGKRFRLQQYNNGPVNIEPLAANHNSNITLTSNNSDRRSFSDVYRSEVTRVAKIGIVVDSKYNERHNGNGLQYALSIINAVDGIYREEFGLALQVITAVSIDDATTDPFDFGDVNIETMLRGFRDYRMQSRLLGPNLSLAHLFSGSRPIDEPVGLAWIDTACRIDGYDVGLSTPYQHDILLAAHEIAHNLGALHDTDTACAASTDKVMWPYISAGTSQQFSSCTVETVKRKLATSCHAEAIDLELALSVESSNTVQATVRNTDTLRSTPAATLAIDLPEGGTATTIQGNCDGDQTGSDQIECTIENLAPGADSVVVFQLDTAATEEMRATVEPDDYIDVQQHNNSGSITRDDNEALVVVQQDQTLASNQSLVQSDATSNKISGGNSGSGAFAGFPLLLIVMMRRWYSSRAV